MLIKLLSVNFFDAAVWQSVISCNESRNLSMTYVCTQKLVINVFQSHVYRSLVQIYYYYWNWTHKQSSKVPYRIIYMYKNVLNIHFPFIPFMGNKNFLCLFYFIFYLQKKNPYCLSVYMLQWHTQHDDDNNNGFQVTESHNRTTMQLLASLCRLNNQK